ncbi:ABC transporter permease [Occultella glacieicola]|uniref:ABC transporter permease n=1 Tax=Occultella glacieicola TaxID=2518684 RepID=A0ABY2EA97_9MICO|nr:ABC transporter permease [Occultella glacieicola]TDE95785.1 ABC transporter permease [Occultella glacieicola]
MSATTTSTTTTRPAGSLARTRALTRMELTLLGRNRTTLFNAIALAPLMALVLMQLIGDRTEGAGAGVFGGTLLTALISFGLLFVAYYNLTTTAVARREELTLKRLTSGTSSRAEVLAAMSMPALLIVLAQAVLGLAAVAGGIEVPPLTNPVLVVLALGFGFVMFAGLAYASSGLTKTVEAAQLTTLPVLMVTMLFSGLTVPFSVLPEPAQVLAQLTPLAPVVTLLNLGLTGITPDGAQVTFAGSLAEALVPLVVLLGWTALGVLATRRWMRWEPRR